jgi:hypothetical protein
MPKHSGAKRDFMQVAREIVEQSIGEQMDGKPLEPARQTKEILMRSLLESGRKGGKARAKALSPAKRWAI